MLRFWPEDNPLEVTGSNRRKHLPKSAEVEFVAMTYLGMTADRKGRIE